MVLMDQISCSGMCYDDYIECLRMCGLDPVTQDPSYHFNFGDCSRCVHHDSVPGQSEQLRDEPRPGEASEQCRSCELPSLYATRYVGDSPSLAGSEALDLGRKDADKRVPGASQYYSGLVKGLRWLGKFGIWLAVGAATLLAATAIGTILSALIYPLDKLPTW